MSVKERFIETFGISEENYDFMHETWMHDMSYFNHNPAEAGYEANITAFINSKAPLFSVLKEKINPDFYNGNLQWLVPIDLPRDEAPDEVKECVSKFIGNVDAQRRILSKKNEDGKTMAQVFAETVEDKPLHYSPKNLIELKVDKNTKLNEFGDSGITRASSERYRNFVYANDAMKNCYTPNINDSSVIDAINNFWPMKPVPVNGMKTAKLFNRLYRSIGFEDTDHTFMQNFAVYSDLVNCNTRHMYMVFSLNPNDYPRMSFGPNWSSCHTIDANNKRRIKITASHSSSYSGMCRAGTLSYANDGVTIIMYIIPANRSYFDHPELHNKVYRNNLHYANHWLVQGRVYPQGNDGKTDLYKLFRYKVHEVLNGSTDNWVRKASGIDGCMGNYIESGPHRLNYEDYFCFNDCNITYEKGYPAEYGDGNRMEIGGPAYCVHCGRMIHSQGSMLCGYCR